MKPFEIALWKHFIDGRGMTTVWINLYRKNHLKDNPTSVEEFLSKVDVKDVCMKAFRFYINTTYGYDYWARTTELWLDFYEANKNNYTSDEWYKLTGMTKILRTNWDAAKHWKEESKLTAAIRLGIDLSLIGAENKTPTAPPTKMSEEYLREKTQKEMAEQKKEKPKNETESFNEIGTGKIFGEFELMSLRPKSHNSRRLKDDEMSINVRSQRGRLTFNQAISKEIIARGGYKYASLLRNKKGEVLLWLNDTDNDGVPVQQVGRDDSHNNVTINSNVLADKVVTFLNIEHDYEIVKVKELEKTKSYVAYLLTTIND